MFLSKGDGFLFLADAILGQNAEPAELRYASSLPLANRVSFNAARDTRDGRLAAKGAPEPTSSPPLCPNGAANTRTASCGPTTTNSL